MGMNDIEIKQFEVFDLKEREVVNMYLDSKGLLSHFKEKRFLSCFRDVFRGFEFD